MSDGLYESSAGSAREIDGADQGVGDVTGRRGGHVIDKARTLPPLNFTAAEMLAMVVPLARAEATPFASALRSALCKVLAAAPAAQTAQAAQLADRVRLIGTRSAVSLAIQEAITARHVLRLRYRDRHDVMTSRGVEPVAFAGTPAHWYLVGWCRLRQGTRELRLDRIHAAADTGEPAPHRSYRDLDAPGRGCPAVSSWSSRGRSLMSLSGGRPPAAGLLRGPLAARRS